jgi:methionine-rich copper-binding protein CopC
MSKTLAAGLFAATLLIAGVAQAHPHLVTATPAVDSTTSGSPKEVRIKFTQAVVLKFTGAEVKAADGKVVKTGAAKLEKGDGTELIVPVSGKLAAGVYSVNWHAVSADTHHVEGSYNFTVK